MVWLIVLVVLFIALGAVAFVVWPLLKPGPAPVMVQDDRLTELIARKDAVMTAIKELEFDHAVGKMSDEDFAVYDQRLRAQAIALMKQIDQVSPESSGLDSTMEAEIAQRRKVAEPMPATVAGAAVAAKPAPAAPTASQGAALDASMEAEIAQRRKVRAPQPAPVSASGVIAATVAAPNGAPAPAASTASAKPRYCTNCGHALEPQHKFCANCGTPVAPVAEQ